MFTKLSFISDCLRKKLEFNVVKALFKKPIYIEEKGVYLVTPVGVYGAIFGKVHGDSSAFRYLFRDPKFCVLSPVLEFYLFNIFKLAEQSWFTIVVPLTNVENIKGKLKFWHMERDTRTATDAELLEPEQKPTRLDTVYYKFTPLGLEIFTHRFSEFLLTSEGCSRNAKLLIFTAQEQSGREECQTPLISVGFYLCSLYSERAEYEQVTSSSFISLFGSGASELSWKNISILNHSFYIKEIISKEEAQNRKYMVNKILHFSEEDYIPSGSFLEITCNTEDSMGDVLFWATSTHMVISISFQCTKLS